MPVFVVFAFVAGEGVGLGGIFGGASGMETEGGEGVVADRWGDVSALLPEGLGLCLGEAEGGWGTGTAKEGCAVGCCRPGKGSSGGEIEDGVPTDCAPSGNMLSWGVLSGSVPTCRTGRKTAPGGSWIPKGYCAISEGEDGRNPPGCCGATRKNGFLGGTGRSPLMVGSVGVKGEAPSTAGLKINPREAPGAAGGGSIPLGL